MVPVQDAPNTIDAFAPGDRVQAHPALDIWWMGDMYGQVESIGGGKVRVKMERSKRTLKFAPGNLLTTRHVD